MYSPFQSKIKMLSDLVSGGSLPPGLWKAAFLLCPPVIERESTLVSSSPYKGTNLIMGPHPHVLI